MKTWRPVVRANKGAAGVDKNTLADVETYGVDRALCQFAPWPRRRALGTTRDRPLLPAPLALAAFDEAGRRPAQSPDASQPCHHSIGAIIGIIKLTLPGWVNYFRTGNAARKYDQLDSYVGGRLRRLLVKRYARNLSLAPWTREWWETRCHAGHTGRVRQPGTDITMCRR